MKSDEDKSNEVKTIKSVQETPQKLPHQLSSEGFTSSQGNTPSSNIPSQSLPPTLNISNFSRQIADLIPRPFNFDSISSK